MIAYTRFEDFSNKNLRRDHIYENGQVFYVPHYAGPGLFFQPTGQVMVPDDPTPKIRGYLCIRLQPTATQKYLRLDPEVVNPNDLPLRIVVPRLHTLLMRGCAYLEFKDL